MTLQKNFLSAPQVSDRLGVSRATVWRWSANGTLPKPVKLGPNTTRWRLSDLEAHEVVL
jgi:prophage regulatory protein